MTSGTSSCRSGSRADGRQPPAGSRRLIARAVSLRNFRSYARLDVELAPGLVLAVGPNGVGKTNLLEALHVGTQGFSPRTRAETQLIRFGAEAARVAVAGKRGGRPVDTEVTVSAGAGKRAKLNGATLQAAEQLRLEVATLVFTPDRLAVVKGGPAVRRAYVDRVLGRLSPARATLPAEYGATLGQRNGGLRRIAAGASSADALEPWTAQLAALGTQLVEARHEAVALLAPGFAEIAATFGLPQSRLRYAGEPLTVEALDARLRRDLDRGATGTGPHLDDLAIVSGSRDLRSFGSQGEQRIAVLSLILAEAETIARATGVPPLLLLDDVLSELDEGRRRALAELAARGGQTVITATAAGALPVSPDQLLEVTPGEVTAR